MKRSKIIFVYSNKGKKKSWLHSPSSSVTVKDKHTHSDNLARGVSNGVCSYNEHEWIDLASCTPPLRYHIHLYEFECRQNQQPLVSITTHTLEVYYTIWIFNYFVPSTVTLAERVRSNLSYPPHMTQKIQETVTKFGEHNKSGVAYFGCSTTRKAETG